METSDEKVNTEALLEKVPKLLTGTTIRWELEGSGPEFQALCELLKMNSIPTIELDVGCQESEVKENRGME